MKNTQTTIRIIVGIITLAILIILATSYWPSNRPMLAGCESGALFSTSTGLKCDGTSIIPQGCPPGAMFDSATGDKCLGASSAEQK